MQYKSLSLTCSYRCDRNRFSSVWNSENKRWKKSRNTLGLDCKKISTLLINREYTNSKIITLCKMKRKKGNYNGKKKMVTNHFVFELLILFVTFLLYFCTFFCFFSGFYIYDIENNFAILLLVSYLSWSFFLFVLVLQFTGFAVPQIATNKSCASVYVCNWL